MTENMLRVGMTGGIASGKSTAAAIFAELGVQVIDADDVVHSQMSAEGEANTAIIKRYGTYLRRTDGSIDRIKLRSKITEPSELAWLEQLLHPLVSEQTFASVVDTDAGYVLFVVPLLFETGFTKHVDRILVVDIDESNQWWRAMQREGMHEEQLKALLARQSSRTYKLKRADYVLDGSLEPTLYRQRIIELDRVFRNQKKI